MKKNGTESNISSKEKYIHFFSTNRNVEIGLVQCGHQYTMPGYGYGPMIRDHYLIHFVISGKGRYYIQKKAFSLKAGNCFLIYPHQIAYYEADRENPWEYCWVGICGYEAENILQLIGFSHQNLVLNYYSDVIIKEIKRITEIGISHQKDAVARDLLLGGIIREVFYYLLKDNQRKKLHADIYEECQTDGISVMGKYNEEYLSIVSSLIQTSFGEDIRVEKIAEKLCLNRSYLSSIFKERTGMSIKQYLTYYRIEQSLHLLKDKNKSISEISHIVGFNNPLYFSRVFRKTKNCSPTEYRKAFCESPFTENEINTNRNDE